MNILITGGSGFIGTRLVDNLLKENHTIKIFDKVKSKKYPELTIVSDVRDEKSLTKACNDIDIIYNLAAEHADDVTPISLYAEVNIGAAKNLVKAAIANDIKNIVFTSSVAIYGLNRGTPDESMEAHPFNEYGRTKNEAEKTFLQWANDENTSLTIVRPAVVFGEKNRGNVYNLTKQIANGKFLMIGKGENKKSMGYVGNIAAFLASLATSTLEGINIYNFADKPDLSSREIIDTITNSLGLTKKIPSAPYWLGLLGGYTFDVLAKITRKKFSISSIRIKKFTSETTINTNKLLASGFKAPYTLEAGLKKMIDYEFK